ncbi:MAG: hypothetical protein JRD87_08465 [Deltaproteobacteria bacterium]|nr:hypothetical protein [Deltaproteobacteria bacterium]
MAKKNNMLDEEAERLFQELGGIDRTKRKTAYEGHLADGLLAKEKELDVLRILLLELTQLLGDFLIDARLLQNTRIANDPFIRLLEILSLLSKKSHRDKNIFIRFRGQTPNHGVPEKMDYVIRFGNIKVDVDTAHKMTKRLAAGTESLTQGMIKAFKIFSERDVSNLYLKFPKESAKEFDFIRISLCILSQYKTALKSNSLIVIEKDGKKMSLPVIEDERGQPDPNLTLVAGLNGLKQTTLQDLITKVNAWLKKSASTPSGSQFVNVYNAMFGIRKLQGKLIRPPIEINNVQHLMLDSAYDGTADEKAPVTKEKLQVTRLAMAISSGSPYREAQVVESVYGNDFAEIDSSRLEHRLEYAADLLDCIEEQSEDPRIENEVLNNIEMRLELVRDDVFDKLFVATKVGRESGEEKTITRRMHENFFKMITFFKGRSVARKKMKAMILRDIDFDEQDYETIGKDFDITSQDAKELIRLLKGCFDQRGRFFKTGFERNIPEFEKHERKIFEFLWHYLKETPHRTDRVSFLNSLQLLIARMKQPKKAIQTLVTDFLSNPGKISFSDRNAVMLANILVRKYNKELMHDIEITPEEVLLVEEGLDRNTADAASKIIDDNEEIFFEKIKTIHICLKQALNPGGLDSHPMPLRFLLSLEREIYIFLSLVDGSVARSVIISALNEYGVPESEIYRLEESRLNMLSLLQLLKAIVRARGRLSKVKDIAPLDKIIQREADFMGLDKGAQHMDLVGRIMKWAMESKEKIAWDNRREPE